MSYLSYKGCLEEIVLSDKIDFQAFLLIYLYFICVNKKLIVLHCKATQITCYETLTISYSADK